MLIQEDLNERTNKSSREKSLREYYNDPNYCKYCGKIIIVNKNESPSNVKRKNFVIIVALLHITTMVLEEITKMILTMMF